MISDHKLMYLALDITTELNDLVRFFVVTIAEDHRQDLYDDLKKIKAILDARKC